MDHIVNQLSSLLDDLNANVITAQEALPQLITLQQTLVTEIDAAIEDLQQLRARILTLTNEPT